VSEPFEIEWLGGVAERHFRRLRPTIPGLPWGTLNPAQYPPELVTRARTMWTQIALSEYRAAASFAEMLRLLLEVRAPLDLVGMAGDFVADEVSHVEIAARVASELGGGAVIPVDTSAILPPLSSEADPQKRANDRMLVVAIHETFSESVATGAMRGCPHPLVKAALELIARDEARHTRIGWLYFDWVADRTDANEYERLGALALGQVAQLASVWRARQSRLIDGRTSEGYLLDDIHALGWIDSEAFAARARDCIVRSIAAPLAQRGIRVDENELARLVAAT
jgi:hypothetical protein